MQPCLGDLMQSGWITPQKHLVTIGVVMCAKVPHRVAPDEAPNGSSTESFPGVLSLGPNQTF
jgi:hypothetical protein